MTQENDIQSCRRLLNEIAEMCDHATLTGSLSGGNRRTAVRYNTVLSHLQSSGAVPQGLFVPLPEESGYGEIGAEARMLAGYLPSNKDKQKNLDEGEKSIIIRLAPFLGQDELGMLIREHANKGIGFDLNTVSNLAPFLGQDVLGDLVRQHLGKLHVEPEAPVKPQAPPSPPARPEASTAPDYRLESVGSDKQDISELLDLLKSPYLSDEERSALVEKLRSATGN